MRGSFSPIFTALLAALLFGACVETAQADYVIGTETDSGFIGRPVNPIAGPGPFIVASDGEAGFFPFGSSYDTSDAIQFDAAGWTPNVAATPVAFAPGFWQQQPGIANTWFLPAVTPGGVENEPDFEPPAQWFNPNFSWRPVVLGTYDILESDGSLSDQIVVANNGPGGTATVTFYSDPNLPGNVVPEPSSLTLLALGITGLAGYSWRRRKTATA